MGFKPLLVLVVAVLVATIVLALKTRRARLSIFRIGAPLLLSVLLFVSLSLPYLIAGIRPNLHFYETRHLLLFGLPGAFFILAAKRFGESMLAVARLSSACSARLQSFRWQRCGIAIFSCRRGR